MSTTNKTRATEATLKLIRAGGLLDYGPDRSRLLLRILRTLGQGRPVSVEQVDQLIDELGISRDDGRALVSQVAERGPDESVVGMFGLTLNETQHRLTVNGNQLFTWCALDTLFLPIVLGQSTSIESESPMGNAKVRLTVSPRRVEAVEPAGAVVSIVAVDPDTADISSVEAVWGTFCNHVFFFATRSDAQAWAAGRDNRDAIEIVSVDEAFELGQLLSSTLLSQAGEQ